MVIGFGMFTRVASGILNAMGVDWFQLEAVKLGLDYLNVG